MHMKESFSYLPELYSHEDTSILENLDLSGLPRWTLSVRQLCDLELLLDSSFFPLEGFVTKADYVSILQTMRLENGCIWPMPINLDVSENFAKQISPHQDIALENQEGVIIALMRVCDIWIPDKTNEARCIFGTDDLAHPGVSYLFTDAEKYYLGGKVTGVNRPVHYDYKNWRMSPNQMRTYFNKMGWQKIVAFQTRNPLHKAHYELTLRAAKQVQANLLIHPVVGLTKPGDIDYHTRVKCYAALQKYYSPSVTTLSLLNLAMRMAGPREAIWHGLIRKNFGCSHFIVGRDHAGPGKDKTGKDFYDPYEAQSLFRKHQKEMGIEMVEFKHMVYVPEKASYAVVDEVPKNLLTLSISGTELRERLEKGLDIPSWFSFPEIVEELRKTIPLRSKQGFTVFFTGLSGSGKSTLAQALQTVLMEAGGRKITLLDGDVVRKTLSSELGFSAEHRKLNIERIAFVAAEVTKHGGIAICAPIAPNAQVRDAIRKRVEQDGVFIEVYVSTSLEECERRDRKGLYKLARQGKIENFTGISDSYDRPAQPELEINTQIQSVDTSVNQILNKLSELHLIS